MNVTETACPRCGETRLRIEWRWEVPPRRFSLSGAHLKMPLRRWPWVVCDACGIEARGETDG